MRFHAMSIPVTPRGAVNSEAEVLRGLTERAVDSERRGFEGFWVAEHHFGRYGGAVPLVGVLLAHIAAKTQRIRLGAGVAVLSLRRDPIATLEEFAMVDALSGGRLELGVGRGFMDHEFEGKGVPLSERVPAFERGLDLLDRFVAGALESPRVTPRPTQQPWPVWLAISTNLEGCRRAAASGHGLMLNPYNRTEEETRTAIGCYLEEWDRHGHETAPRVLANQILFTASTTAEVRRRAEAPVNSYLAAVSDAIEGGEAARRLPRKTYDDLVPGKLLVGTPPQVSEALLHWQELGVTDVSLMTHVGDPESPLAEESVDLFCHEVMPLFTGSGH